MTPDRARLARTVLACLFEPGSRPLHELLVARGAAGALDAICSGEADPVLVETAASRLPPAGPTRLAEAVLARTVRLGARVVVPEDEEWPRQLDHLSQISHEQRTRIDRDTYPPACLWVRGERPLAEVLDRSVAVVGARAATAYGCHTATELGHGLASAGWTVVSGGAYGIDTAAHRGALSADGLTVAVLACGMDRPYPAGNAALFERIATDGLLISEWPPGADPHRYRFLVRNRVIAALTRGTVMVEANARSGARHTLGRAAALRRPAMVIPGPVTSAMSVGCHQAIRAGARLVTCHQEVLEEVGRIGDDLAPLPRGPVQTRDRVSPELTRVLDAVPLRGAAHPGQVAASAGVPLREALRALPQLEAAGLVVQGDDGWTARRDPHPAP